MMSTAFSFGGFTLLMLPILSCYFVRKIYIDKGAFLVPDVALTLLICSILIANFYVTYFYWNQDSGQIGNLYHALVGGVAFFCVADLSRQLRTKTVIATVNFFLVVNLLVLLIQLVSYYFFSINFDVGRVLGGDGNRAMNYVGIYRPTGIYDEPAIYGLFNATLLAIRMLYSRKIDMLMGLALAGIVLTLSLISAILAFGLLMIAILRRFGASMFFVVVAVLAGIVLMLFMNDLAPIYVSNRIDALTIGDDGSTNNKIEVLKYWLRNEHVKFFGFGFIGLRDWTPNYFDAIYDMSIFGTALMQFGLVGVVPFMVWLILVISTPKFRLDLVLLSLVIFVKLAALNFMFFWVFVGMYRGALRGKSNGH